VLQVRDLTTTYQGLIAIFDVSLDVASGEIVWSPEPTAPSFATTPPAS
jgi:hypothetical protein